jgi:hypothetical protein
MEQLWLGSFDESWQVLESEEGGSARIWAGGKVKPASGFHPFQCSPLLAR